MTESHMTSNLKSSHTKSSPIWVTLIAGFWNQTSEYVSQFDQSDDIITVAVNIRTCNKTASAEYHVIA